MITPLRMTLGDLVSPINRGETRKKNSKKEKKKKEKIEEFEPREMTKLKSGCWERDRRRRKKIRKKKR